MDKLSKQEIKRLSRYKIKKYRQQDSIFLAEGTKIVSELIQSAIQINQLVVTQNWLDKNNTLPVDKYTVRISDDKDFKKISSLSEPEGIIAECAIPKHKEFLSSGWTIVLDQLNNPGNLGTIIRIADWFNIQEIVCSEDTVDAYNPKVIQATMGSIARISIHYTNLNDYLEKQNRQKLAATLEGIPIQDYQFQESGILIIGSESHGISQSILNLCSAQITIPRLGQAESLNAAVATGIMVSYICL